LQYFETPTQHTLLRSFRNNCNCLCTHLH